MKDSTSLICATVSDQRSGKVLLKRYLVRGISMRAELHRVQFPFRDEEDFSFYSALIFSAFPITEPQEYT